MGIADTSIAAAAAVFSGGAAFGAWKTAREANRTSASLAQIERDRWHTEMTPHLRFQFTRSRGNPELLVLFDGPAPLRRINRLELSIRDDRDRSSDPVLAGGVTAEERAKIIWGPYRFRPGIDGADESGRNAGAFHLEHGEKRRLALDPSLSPSWFTDSDPIGGWRWEQSGNPIRLWATCHVAGHKDWRLTADLPGEPMEWTEWVTAR
ncbi:hypothetical protein [Streptomyces sp. NPDC001108]